MLIAVPAAFAPSAPRAEYSDCRTCHYATAIDGGTPDYTAYFVAPGHHPVRVSYPANAEYNQPGGAATGLLFFDHNGNGAADPDEIQIFNSGAATSSDSWVIDCASCHAEHGGTPPDPGHAPDYLRTAGGDHRLCLTCHRL